MIKDKPTNELTHTTDDKQNEHKHVAEARACVSAALAINISTTSIRLMKTIIIIIIMHKRAMN